MPVVPGTITLPNDQDASGRSFGIEELDALRSVLESGTLISTKGTYVKRLEQEFAQKLGARHAIACASGTAAVHTAIAALDLEPGDEVITSPITDMGALAPILYQGAIPVFADVDPETCNVTAKTIASAYSDRTRAIVVTHLFGTPCAMGDIMKFAGNRDVPVIEDCAQAFLAKDGGRNVGTIGALGCFSLQQGKHMTCGEGGIVTTNDDALARRAVLFVNKAWGYGDPAPDHYFLAPNYRLSELQGAVAHAQLQRLDQLVERRIEIAERLSKLLSGVEGVGTPAPAAAGRRNVYWKYGLRIDTSIYPQGPNGFARELRGYDVASVPRYIQKPAFACAIFTERRTFGRSQYPFTLARAEALDYRLERFPGTVDGLAHLLVLPL
ncbi:MAG: DegT/DnrJ/EryC1/StrS family aminotransferase, partial [Candidatus Eremiobacteraeota bacterium]|nr:DegT/DnrJ/EryC1/StrS family aminotransferase [Candidatus Eremiobacteraeota bacterium]